MRSIRRLGLLALSLISLAACGQRSSIAYGDANSIVLIIADSVWDEAGSTIQQILEPRIQTVRNERTFDLTPIAPDDPDLTKLRLWRQVLVVGEATDPWVAAALPDDVELSTSEPTLVDKDDVWARGQRVTAIVLPPGGGTGELVEILPELHQILDQRFRNYALNRMFVSGRNDSLTAELREKAGFALTVPNVYRVSNPEEDVYLFLNDQMVGGELIRMIQVTWRPGARELPTVDEVLEWRIEAGEGHYSPEQMNEETPLESVALEGVGAGGIEVRGVWSAEIDGYPMAGPFISRVISCPAQDRTYLLDSWLYAPAKDKYEYILQLETILNSFDCGT